MKRKVLRSQTRETVMNVYKFMKHESETGVKNIKAIQQRTAAATGISLRTLQRTVAQNISPSDFKTSGKRKGCKKRVTGIDGFSKGIIKKRVHRFHVTNKQFPSLGRIFNKIQTEINFKGSQASLQRLIKTLGFTWKKTNTNKKILLEHTETRLKRIEYLDKIRRYREGGRTIVFTDESYSTRYVAGQRIVIMHAGTEKGILKNCMLLFKAGMRSGEYAGDLNYANYEKWVRNKLIPNLEPESVVVIGNASYHNKPLEPIPYPFSPRSEMIAWLRKQGVQFDEDALKPKLYKLIALYKDPMKAFSIDKLLNDHKHTVLRVPPYHPDLNPIKMVVEMAITNAAEKNPERDVSKAIGLVNGFIDAMTPEEWNNIYQRIDEIECEYMLSDPAIDALTDKYMDRVDEGSETASSDEECSDASNTDADSSSESDSDDNRDDMSWDDLLSCL